jgi:nucleoside-diphosphate kinase
MEQTFVMIKPDGVQRGLVGEILSRFEKKGFKIVAAKFGVLSEAVVDKHYEEHLEKPFYPGMKAYLDILGCTRATMEILASICRECSVYRLCR